MKLFRAGKISDDNLKEGYWWSNSLKQIKPYFKGKIVVIDIELNEKLKKRYMLTKEIKKYGHHDGFGVWTRLFSTISEEFDENYYYISPEYLKNSRFIGEYTGKDAFNKIKKEYNIKI